MKKEIVVLDRDPNTNTEMCGMLAGQPFAITQVKSLGECEAFIRCHACRALILDLDTIPVDNRTIVSFKKRHPAITIFAKSRRRYHPELEESLRDCIFACLAKPLDPAELQFWMRSLISVNDGQ